MTLLLRLASVVNHDMPTTLAQAYISSRNALMSVGNLRVMRKVHMAAITTIISSFNINCQVMLLQNLCSCSTPFELNSKLQGSIVVLYLILARFTRMSTSPSHLLTIPTCPTATAQNGRLMLIGSMLTRNSVSPFIVALLLLLVTASLLLQSLIES
jgi:hypothetical protein